VGWTNVWILDGPGLGPDPVLVFVGTRDLVCDILSLVLSTYYYILYWTAWATMLYLNGYRFINFICGTMPRQSWPCTCLSPPRYSTINKSRPSSLYFQ